MKSRHHSHAESGFSMVELLVAMAIILVALALVGTMFARSLAVRQRESSRTDALTAAQAALNVISREVANSGYGLADNGIVYADSTTNRIHIRSNIVNDNNVLTDPGENVTYYFDPGTQSILRYDANGAGIGTPQTSIVVNRISDLNFQYFQYVGSNPIGTAANVSTFDTGRVRVTVKVKLEQVVGQVNPGEVVLVSDVTLRNADYMLRQY
jgi:prepilin-type N-terminal cleavage/methylation domain-containing protein